MNELIMVNPRAKFVRNTALIAEAGIISCYEVNWIVERVVQANSYHLTLKLTQNQALELLKMKTDLNRISKLENETIYILIEKIRNFGIVLFSQRTAPEVSLPQ